jgi:arsenite methyltransferase
VHLQLPSEVEWNSRSYVNAWDEVSLWCSRFGTLLLDSIELRPNTVGLDLASGTGFPVIELAQMHGATCRFVGVDSWPLAIVRAEAKRAEYNVPNLEFAVADGAALPFSDRSFNLVTMNLGVNNLADVKGVFAEAARVSATGARFLLTSNVQGHMPEFYAAFRAVLKDLDLMDRVSLVDEHEAHRLSADVLVPMLEECGFSQAKVTERKFQMRYLDFDALLNHLLTRVGFLPGWRATLPPEREVEVFEEVGRRLEAGGRPITMTVPMLLLETVKT